MQCKRKRTTCHPLKVPSCTWGSELWLFVGYTAVPDAKSEVDETLIWKNKTDRQETNSTCYVMTGGAITLFLLIEEWHMSVWLSQGEW